MHSESRAAKRGCFKRGGFPIWTCPSFFVLFCPFGTITRHTRQSHSQGIPPTLNQGPLNRGVSNGGASRSGRFLSFFVLWDFPFFLGFSRFVRGLSGNFPIRPFPLSRPIKSTYEEQSRKGPRHNLDLSRKKWETPGFGNTPV